MSRPVSPLTPRPRASSSAATMSSSPWSTRRTYDRANSARSQAPGEAQLRNRNRCQITRQRGFQQAVYVLLVQAHRDRAYRRSRLFCR